MNPVLRDREPVVDVRQRPEQRAWLRFSRVVPAHHQGVAGVLCQYRWASTCFQPIGETPSIYVPLEYSGKGGACRDVEQQ